MKPFEQWMQDLAESKPEQKGAMAEPDSGFAVCEYCEGQGATGQTYSAPCGEQCPECMGSGQVEEVECSGSGCGGKKGAPNYRGGIYYCGGTQWCCP